MVLNFEIVVLVKVLWISTLMMRGAKGSHNFSCNQECVKTKHHYNAFEIKK